MLILLSIQVLTLFLLYKYKNIILKSLPLIDRAGLNKRKIHKFDTPKIGGLILYICVSEFFILQNFLFNTIFLDGMFFLFLTSIFIIGLLDDMFNLNANLKLILMSIIIFFFIGKIDYLQITFLNIESINKHFYLGGYSNFFITLCFLLAINAYNMSDGVDGLFLTLSSIIFLYLVLSVKTDIFLFTILFLVFCLFVLNINKKIFMGDSGVFVIVCIFSTLIIKNYNLQNFNIDSVEEIFLLMSIPGLDMLRLFIKRIINKKHPFKADMNHLHHLLLQKKISSKIVVCIISIFILVPLSIYKLEFNFFAISSILVLTYIFIINYLSKKK